MPPSSISSAFALPYLTRAVARSAGSAATATSILKNLPSGFNPHARVGQWIVVTAGMVVGMIHIGGLTRLTGSGLSMTTWHPLGTVPPLTKMAWEEEFARYKTFPEWQQRQSMTLSEFQTIYAWEYGHRMLGRCVGIVFAVPWLYFTVRRQIPAGFQPRMFGLVSMGAAQGAVGWWMVKSGLGEDRRGDSKEIRVKPLRLASHLSMAFATYGALVWTALDIFSLPHGPNKGSVTSAASSTTMELVQKQFASLPSSVRASLQRLRLGGVALTGLAAITVVSGALVAGNDAGRAYNTFPKMGDEWIPEEVTAWLFGDNSDDSTASNEVPLSRRPWSDDSAVVQFNHRMLGMATAGTGLAVMGVGLALPAGKNKATAILLTPQVRKGLYAVGLSTVGQMTLGITTLLHYVPISLAALHQMGSVVVFTSGVYLVHALRYASGPAIATAARSSAARSTVVGAGGVAAGTAAAAAAARAMSSSATAAIATSARSGAAAKGMQGLSGPATSGK